MATTARLNRVPSETRLYSAIGDFDSFARSDDRRNQRRWDHDPAGWTDDLMTSRTERSRGGARYAHATNYPDKLLMRRAKSVSSLYNDRPNSARRQQHQDTEQEEEEERSRSRPQSRSMQTTDRFTQTMVNRYTQTPPGNYRATPDESDYNAYCRQLLSPTGRRPVELGKATDFGQLHSYMRRHGPALYRYGGKGAPWRHLKMTSGIAGENIMFVDGSVKEFDSWYFPPSSTRRRDPELTEFNGFHGYPPQRPQTAIQY